MQFKCQNSSISDNSVQHKYIVYMSNNSIWPTDRILSGATMPGQSGPGSNSNKAVLHISQNFSISGASSSDFFMSYPAYSLGNLTPLQKCSWCILQSQLTELWTSCCVMSSIWLLYWAIDVLCQAIGFYIGRVDVPCQAPIFYIGSVDVLYQVIGFYIGPVDVPYQVIGFYIGPVGVPYQVISFYIGPVDVLYQVIGFYIEPIASSTCKGWFWFFV